MKNTGRQLEIDIAKGFAIICMVLVHTIEYFYNGSSSAANAVVEFLGSPFAAPVFMFALGVGVNYTKNSSPEHYIKRGCQMFVLSYVYNFFVYAAPYLSIYFKTGDFEYFEAAVIEFSNVDILQFAALAFFTFAIVKKFNWNKAVIIGYAAAVSLIGQYLTNTVELPEGGLSYVLGLFWGSSEISFFPYCSWIAFPLIGYIFGKELINTENKAGLYASIAKVSIPVYFAMMANAAYAGIDFGQLTGEYQVSYYHMGIYGNVCLLAFVFGWLSICYLISMFIPEGIMAYFIKLSRNITKIYVVQYILIIYTYVFIAGEESNLLFIEAILAFALVFFLSDKIADIYISLRPAGRKQLARN